MTTESQRVASADAASQDVRGDLRWATIGDLIGDAARRFGDRHAVVDLPRRLTYSQLLGEVRRFSRALLARQVHVGDRVAIWAPNSWRWIVAALGAQSIGAAIVPLNTRYRGLEAAYILERARPGVLVVGQRFLGRDFVAMLRGAGLARELWPTIVDAFGDDGPDGNVIAWEEFYAELAPEDELESQIADVNGSVVSDILFTSGTTGRPKGVMTTHAQNLRAYFDYSRLAGMLPEDRYAIVNPFFHAFGYKVGWLASLMHGITMYPHATLQAGALLDQIEQERITLLPGPPALYNTLFADESLPSRDLSSLRLAITGAASIPPRLIQRLYKDLGFERVTTCYGMTEGTGVATVSRATDDVQILINTSGSPLPGVEVRVVDPVGSECAPGESGEVRVRGYNVMAGYFDDPRATARFVDSDGWMHTGDIGRFDEQGNLSVIGRQSDMFIVGGFNVYPAEVEAMLADHPEVREAAVIGIPDQRLGEVGMAFVVPTMDGSLTADGIRNWAVERMANFKVPARFEVVSELPRNATGKVLKQKLRETVGRDDSA